MKTFLLATTLAALTFTTSVPAFASVTPGSAFAIDSLIQGEFDGRRPRVPGGSGCDSPRDVREHPECRV